MEFKDYYAILEIDRYASFEEIKAAYRSLSKQWHPDLNPGRNVTQKMQDINEAYAILKILEKKVRYDLEYDNYYRTEWHSQEAQQENQSKTEYNVHDENLKQDIFAARQYAENIVADFFNNLKDTSKVAVKGAWEESKGYLICAIIMSVVGTILLLCLR